MTISTFFTLGLSAGKMRSTPTPWAPILRTVKVLRWPPRRIAITVPSKIWMRVFAFSLTFSAVRPAGGELDDPHVHPHLVAGAEIRRVGLGEIRLFELLDGVHGIPRKKALETAAVSMPRCALETTSAWSVAMRGTADRTCPILGPRFQVAPN